MFLQSAALQVHLRAPELKLHCDPVCTSFAHAAYEAHHMPGAFDCAAVALYVLRTRCHAAAEDRLVYIQIYPMHSLDEVMP